MLSPLEQFEFFIICAADLPLIFPSAFFNSAVLVFALFFLFIVLINELMLVRTVYNVRIIIFECLFFLVKFCYLILDSAIRNRYFLRQYLVFYFLSFIFVLFSNLVGLLPYGFTLTSQVVLTFGLSFFFFLGINITSIQRHGLNYFSLFLPAGSPFYLSFLLVPIEILSYLARVFSLSIRLFANMVSGHCLLKILAGFAWTMLIAGSLPSFFVIFVITAFLLVMILEFVVAFLQAYVYCLLLSIYIRDCVNLH